MKTPCVVRAPLAVFAGVALAACGAADRDAAPAASQPRPIAFPGAPGSGQPRLAAGGDGTPVLSWLEPEGDHVVLRHAAFVAGAFTEPVEVTRGADLVVNWADLPSVQPITADFWAAHWLKRAPNSAGAYHVATSVSADGGATWSAPVQLNDDVTETEHGFVELFPWSGALGAFWLDGRQLAEWSFDAPDALLGTSLRVARLDRSGAVLEREVVDELVCDCCQPDLALASRGPVVAYRDRTAEELRDIVIRRHVDGRWHDAVAVGADGWRIEGCPVNGPAIAAAGERVAVAWFSAAHDEPRVRFAWSLDGGASFLPAIELDGAGSFGQTKVLLAGDGTALVTWWRASISGGLDLALRTVAADGALGGLRVLAHSTAAQPVDVPQLIGVGSGALVAWTSLDGAGAVHVLFADNLR